MHYVYTCITERYDVVRNIYMYVIHVHVRVCEQSSIYNCMCACGRQDRHVMHMASLGGYCASDSTYIDMVDSSLASVKLHRFTIHCNVAARCVVVCYVQSVMCCTRPSPHASVFTNSC